MGGQRGRKVRGPFSRVADFGLVDFERELQAAVGEKFADGREQECALRGFLEGQKAGVCAARREASLVVLLVDDGKDTGAELGLMGS